jgi:hypothetical protein
LHDDYSKLSGEKRRRAKLDESLSKINRKSPIIRITQIRIDKKLLAQLPELSQKGAEPVSIDMGGIAADGFQHRSRCNSALRGQVPGRDWGRKKADG